MIAFNQPVIGLLRRPQDVLRAMERILVVDDDTELCGLLGDYLRKEGFEYDFVHTGGEGIRDALSGAYDLLVLDVMLPETNGFDVLREIRLQSRIPVIMLTARGDAVDRIVGLEMGADDYLAKPFHTRELIARIRALLRRCAAPPVLPPPSTLSVGEITLDRHTRTVTREGTEVRLTATEFRLLQTLLREAGRVISRERLSKLVLKRAHAPYDRSLDVHVSSLRKKLWGENDKTSPIQAVRGDGYILALPSQTSEPGHEKPVS